MKFKPRTRIAAIFTLLFGGPYFHAEIASAQVFDFGQIDAAEINGHRNATRRISSQDNCG